MASIAPLDLRELIPEPYADYRPVGRSVARLLRRTTAGGASARAGRQPRRAAGGCERAGASADARRLLSEPAQARAGSGARRTACRSSYGCSCSRWSRLPAGELDPAELAAVDAEISSFGSDIVPAAQALARGSVAIVIPFEGSIAGEAKSGVLKVLRPGIEERLQEELELWPRLGEFLDQQCRAHGLPTPDYGDAADRGSRPARARDRSPARA